MSVFQQDATTLEGDPAPACAGGAYVVQAAADWAAAAAAYQQGVQIVGSNPTMGGIDQGGPYMSKGNRALSHAEKALKRAVRKSRGRIWNVIKGTGTG